MSEATEVAVKPLPRRGRWWVALLLALGLIALGYTIVNISTQKPDRGVVHVSGIAEAQEIFGGVPQEGVRLGSSDAPVTIQLFNDVQCASCREAFLETMPGLVEKYVRPGDVKLLYRHYSNSESPQELGFYGSGIVDLVFDIEPTEKSRGVVTAREHRAESRSIARLLSPRSIAVIGASSEPTKIGHAVLRNLLRGGFTGAVYPVNPDAGSVQGVHAIVLSSISRSRSIWRW